jgi:quercetin dioxygenase-like cupin family protein
MSTSPMIPRPKRVVTGHNSKGKGIIEVVDQGKWTEVQEGKALWNVMWSTTTFPIDSAKDNALEREKEEKVLSLSLPNGTVLRMVDRAPGTQSAMHRSQTVDYGVVLEGEMEMLMDSGESVILRPGDVCIQRGTLHQWRNNTSMWNRMLFVLMDAKPLDIGGKLLTGESGYEGVKGVGSRL